MARGDYKNIKSSGNVLLVARGAKDSKSAANNQNKLVSILGELFDQVYLITFCDKEQGFHLPENHIYQLDSYQNRVLSFIFNQLTTTKAIRQACSNTDIDLILFSFGRDLDIIPIVYAKILGKKVILRSSGRPTKILSEYIGDKNKIKCTLFRFIEEINYRVVDRILTECEYAIQANDFEKYGKAYRANLFVDINQFHCKKDCHERQFDIGYIGRFSEEKGVLNFLRSIPLLLQNKPDLKFFIAGEGELMPDVIHLIENMRNQHNITLHQWIPHEELSEYLNEIRFLVIPSKYEGLPNMAIEAMSCRTIVLATPVGSIPGVIRDSETGFIIEERAPDGIIKCINRALDNPNQDKIAENAEYLVLETFSFNKTVDSLRKALSLAD